MRHSKKINHLGRTSSHRKAMLANMAMSLIMHKRISTTTAKAKALKVYVEPIITRSKNDTTHSRRIVFSYLQDKNTVTELFRNVAPKVAGRPGGYTRILKTGFREGDNAEMCIIELVDFNETYVTAAKETKSAAKSGTRRSRKSSTVAAKPAEAKAPKAEAPKAEESVIEEAQIVSESPVEEVAAPEVAEDKAAE